MIENVCCVCGCIVEVILSERDREVTCGSHVCEEVKRFEDQLVA